MKYFLNIFFCFSFTSSFAQYAYKDTTTFPPPKQIARIESHRVVGFGWSVLKVANPAVALINEGGRYQFGYTSQWAFMVGNSSKTKIFAEYSYIPARFIPHIFHAGTSLDILAVVDSGLVFDFAFGFTPGVGLFADFQDYGVSAEYALWFEITRFSRFFVRYRFNFWITNKSIGYQDFAAGLSIPF